MKELEKNIYSMDISSCTISAIPNKYHKDDTINEFLEHVRYTELETDAIANISILLKDYEEYKKYTFLEKLKILFK